MICFLCQQSAEKYLKAFLVRSNIPFRKTHDLDELARTAMTVDHNFKLIQRELDQLFPYAVVFRYPGATATELETREAIEAMKHVRDFVRARLGLKTK